MTAANQNGLKRGTARRRKRRTSVVTKAKYKPRTARQNRNLIMSNAKAITMLRRMQGPPVYTDYQYNNEFISDFNATDTQVFSDTLASPRIWRECLRTDENILDASTTYWRNMTLNIRVNLGLANYAQWSVFVVTPRRDNNSFSFEPASFLEGRQYVVGPEGFNPILNSSQFKVWAVRHVSLTQNAWKQPVAQIGPQDQLFAGNPMSTYRKFQFSIRVNAKLRNPQVSGQNNQWKDMIDIEMPYFRRFHIIAFCQSRFTLNPSSGAPTCSCNWHQLNTCINNN